MADTSKIPFVAVPFADRDDGKVANIDFLKSGVTREMSVPSKTGGMKFTRQMLNGIGYFATLGGFLDRIGYPYGKERDRGADFGGYPKGAILISEDDDYVREYVSQIDNNKMPLPQEAADGTYEGNEYWKPTLPPIVDFYPDFSTYSFKAAKDITGIGSYQYIPDEDGWYRFEMLFSGRGWPEQATFGNALYSAICTASLSQGFELFRLDGRSAITETRAEYSRSFPISTATIPLRKGVKLYLKYKLTDEEGYEGRLRIGRWGITAL